MSLLINELIVFCIALMATALFSYLETTITAVRFFKIRELAQSTPRYARLLAILEKQPDRILITMLIANNLANVTAAALITRIMQRVFSCLCLSAGLGFSVGIAVATLAILIFGEIIPKNFAKMHGEKLIGSTLWLINVTYYALYPIVKMLSMISDFIIHRTSANIGTSSQLVTSEKEIKFLIQYINEKGLMEREKSAMLQNVFRICNTQIKEILIPEPDMVTIRADATVQQAMQLFVRCQFSRLPVYEGREDNIIGLLYQKDLFASMQREEYTKSIREIIRPVLFVPENMRVNQILKDFRAEQLHMAIVLNEHGAVVGLVTLEDVLEEIVGEIKDEHEVPHDKIVSLEDKHWLVNGNTSLDELATLLGVTFQAESVTLAGFLTEVLQHLPKKGERIEYKDYIFQVQKVSPRRILQVLIFHKNKLPN